MLRNILVPVDGSRLAERALILAVPLADQHNATLTLVSVHEPIPEITLGGGAPVRDPALDHKWRGDHHAYLTKLAKRVGRRTTASVQVEFLDGKIVPTLAQYAAEHAVDLIVMCTHGRGGFQRFWMGSVADGLSRRTTVPLLLARGGRATGTRMLQDPVFRRVLVPLDGSVRSEGAVKHVLDLMGSGPGAITLAHIVHPMMAATTVRSADAPVEDVRNDYLAPLAARFRRDRIVVNVDARVEQNVAKGVMAIADAHDADLIALATQGMGSIERFVMGSVADKLIRTARVPVLVCPAPAKSPG